MTDIKKVILTPKTTFTATVQKVGGRVTTTDPITVKNQISEIRTIDDIQGINIAHRTDGSTLIYNANTGEYDVKPYNVDDLLSVGNLYVTTLYANNSAGLSGQVLHTNSTGIYWGPTLEANNATYAYGKVEGALAVNSAVYATNAQFAYTANNSTYAYGKTENVLNVNAAIYATNANFAYTANNSAHAFGKTENVLNVNSAVFASNADFAYTANNATYAYGKTENVLNVNSAVYATNVINTNITVAYANNAYFLNGLPGTYYTNATNISTGTLDSARLPNTSVVSGVYGNASSIPVITVDQYGRLTSVSTSAVAGVTSYNYNSGNNTFSIATGDGSVFRTTIDTVNDLDVSTRITFADGVTINSITYTGTANNADYAYGKTENVLNVNSAVFSTNAHFAYTANNAALLDGQPGSYYTNATNISAGTLAEPRLPYRMDQNVRTTDNVEFHNLTLTGNVVIGGNVTVITANNIVTTENMIYLNANAHNVNPDIGFTAGYNDGIYHHTGFFRDASDGRWKIFDSYLPEPDESIYIDTTNTSFRIADFQANIVYSDLVHVGNTSVYTTITNDAFSGTANNATYAYGKTEDVLNVNSAVYATNSEFAYTANNASYLQGLTWNTPGAIGATAANTGSFTTLDVSSSAKIVVQGGVDGTSTRGIYLWYHEDTNWGIYMAQAGADKSFSDGTATAGLDGNLSWAVRNRSASADAGWIWENEFEQAMMQLTPSTGNLLLKGTINAVSYSFGTSNAVVNSTIYTGQANTALYFNGVIDEGEF